MLRRLGLVLVLLVASLPPADAAGRRVALVVGAANYNNVPRLANTLNDAKGMAAALARTGFEVETLLDPDRAAIDAAVRRLGQRAQAAEASLFYFAGHALDSAGRDWLVPVNAELADESSLRVEAIDMDAVLDQTQGRAEVSLLLLDASRDNPFRLRLTSSTGAVARGLAHLEAPVGTLIAFASAPGTVAEEGAGPNSPFTGALMKDIDTPGLDVRQVMNRVRRDVQAATNGRQIPWDTSVLEGDFYFRSPPTRQIAASARPAADSQTEIDVTFWKSVENTQDRGELQAYLNKFPNGIFAELARARIARLRPPSIQIMPAPEPAPQPPAPKPPAVAANTPPNVPLQPPPAVAANTPPNIPVQPPPAVAANTPPSIPVQQPPPLRPPPPIVPAPTNGMRPPNPPGPAIPPVVRPGPAVSDPFGQRLAALLPQMAPQARDDFVRTYRGLRDHKALAAVPGTGQWWRIAGYDSGTDVATKALEGCQINNGTPCALVMVDDNLVPAPVGAAETTRNMARVSYRGFFDPILIPLLQLTDLKRPDILGYKLATGAKAMALHVTGRIAVVTKAPDQRTAEESALAQCNRDRGGNNAPCYLYAVMDRVVLPQRLTAPRPPPTTVSDALILVAGNDRIAESYRSDREHKALALEIDGARTYKYTGAPDRATAEQYVLEFCLIRWNTPCVLVASDDELKTPDPSAAPRRAVPRMNYAGPYKPEMVPLFSNRQTKELVDYPAMTGPKAMAIGAAPLRAKIASGRTDKEAETKALAACNDPPDSPIPCILYAVNDRVILPQRRTEPSQ